MWQLAEGVGLVYERRNKQQHRKRGKGQKVTWDLIESKRKKRRPESPRIKSDPIPDLLCSVAISHFHAREWMHPSQYEEIAWPIFSASVFPLLVFFPNNLRK